MLLNHVLLSQWYKLSRKQPRLDYLLKNYKGSFPHIPAFYRQLFSFIFCRTSHSELDKLHEILGVFEGSFGLAINFQKYKIYFSRNTPQLSKDHISHALGVTFT